MNSARDGAGCGGSHVRLLLGCLLSIFILAFLPLVGAHSPSGLDASMTVDRAEASPGEGVTFVIAIDPGSDYARDLSVNDILPSGLTFVAAQAPPSCAGGNGTWVCRRPDLEPFTIEIRTVIGPGTEGTELTNVARIMYTYDNDPEVVTVQAGVRIVPVPAPGEPNLTVQFNVSQEVLVPGGEANYRIRITNNGTAHATNVSVVATMPIAMVLVSASASPTVRPGEVAWLLGTLPVDSVELLFNMTVLPSSDLAEVSVAVEVAYDGGPAGTVHVHALPSSLRVVPASGGLSVPAPLVIIVGVVAVGAIGLFALPRVAPLAFRPGERADEVFLLHRSGIVLAHFSDYRPQAPDSDIVGGMMAAVQMFVEDSVNPNAGPLREIRFGRGNILFVAGENVTLAAVNPRGSGGRFVESATRFLQEFERMNQAALANFDGNAAGLVGLGTSFDTFTRTKLRAEDLNSPAARDVPRQ